VSRGKQKHIEAMQQRDDEMTGEFVARTRDALDWERKKKYAVQFPMFERYGHLPDDEQNCEDGVLGPTILYFWSNEETNSEGD